MGIWGKSFQAKATACTKALRRESPWCVGGRTETSVLEGRELSERVRR